MYEVIILIEKDENYTSDILIPFNTTNDKVQTNRNKGRSLLDCRMIILFWIWKPQDLALIFLKLLRSGY